MGNAHVEADERGAAAAATHYWHKNSGGRIFVKDADLFAAQGGHLGTWGVGWNPIVALDDRDAREKAQALLSQTSSTKSDSTMLARDNTEYERITRLIREGEQARRTGHPNPYHGQSVEHALHATGWVKEDLRLALIETSPSYAKSQAGRPEEAPSVKSSSGIVALDQLSTDAMEWAKAFVSIAKSPQFKISNLWDEGYMVGWFANAIEASRMSSTREERMARDALEYVYGKTDLLCWDRIVTEKFTPPWPKSGHVQAMGLDPEANIKIGFEKGFKAGMEDARSERKSAWQDWVLKLPIMQQSVLASAVRAPDGMRKFHPAKMLVRWYRRSVLVSAFDGKPLLNPYESGGGSFTGPLTSDYTEDQMADEFMIARDEMSLHYYAHMMHAAQIVGCYHPDEYVRDFWDKLYNRMVNALHLKPETYSAMARRLNDDPQAWSERSDEAASCTD